MPDFDMELETLTNVLFKGLVIVIIGSRKDLRWAYNRVVKTR
jgi:hypothetical protein